MPGVSLVISLAACYCSVPVPVVGHPTSADRQLMQVTGWALKDSRCGVAGAHLSYSPRAIIMRRREIINQTGIGQTTFATYFRAGIIQVLSENEVGRDYHPDSVPRVELTRQLTGLGFKVDNVRILLERAGLEEVRSRLNALPAGDFQRWADEQLQSPSG